MICLAVYNHQSRVVITDDLLDQFTRSGNMALPMILEHPANGGGVLGDMEEVEISIVNDEVIAQVHEDFMDIPGATDVITFAHGEIVISAETALEYGAKYESSFEKELMLYIIHGLLHLAGHEDADPEERAVMEGIQTRILDEVWNR